MSLKKASADQSHESTSERPHECVTTGWEVKELQAVSAINYGYTESASHEAIGPRFLRITDIQNDRVDWRSTPYCRIGDKDIDKYRLASGDIVFARTGATTGKSFLVRDPPEAVFASYLIRLRLTDSRLLPEFVSLFFQTGGYWRSIREGSSGSAQGGFNASKLGALLVPVPPLPGQRRIVRILDEALESIAAAKTNAQRNLDSVDELLDGSVQEILSRRPRGRTTNTRTLADLCEMIVDCEHKTAPTQEQGIPSIRTPNIGKGKLILDGVNRVSEETYREWTRRAEPLPGDLILAREAPAGNVAVIPPGLKVCLGQRTVLIRPKRDVFEPEFLARTLLSPEIQEILLGHSRGATVQHVNMKDIRALVVNSVPSLSMQRECVSLVDGVDRETARLRSIYKQKLAALDALKQSLLHQAFTGQL